MVVFVDCLDDSVARDKALFCDLLWHGIVAADLGIFALTRYQPVFPSVQVNNRVIVRVEATVVVGVFTDKWWYMFYWTNFKVFLRHSCRNSEFMNLAWHSVE